MRLAPRCAGLHRSRSPARSRVTATTAGSHCASTCSPGALHLRPPAARTPGSAGSPVPETYSVPSARVRSPTCACGVARSGPGLAANARPAPPSRALRPRRGCCRSPRSRDQTRVPSPPRRAGKLCRAAAVAAAAHYHRPARAAAALKRQRPTRRRRWVPPSALFCTDTLSKIPAAGSSLLANPSDMLEASAGSLPQLKDE